MDKKLPQHQKLQCFTYQECVPLISFDHICFRVLRWAWSRYAPIELHPATSNISWPKWTAAASCIVWPRLRWLHLWLVTLISQDQVVVELFALGGGRKKKKKSHARSRMIQDDPGWSRMIQDDPCLFLHFWFSFDQKLEQHLASLGGLVCLASGVGSVKWATASQSFKIVAKSMHKNLRWKAPPKSPSELTHLWHYLFLDEGKSTFPKQLQKGFCV